MAVKTSRGFSDEVDQTAAINVPQLGSVVALEEHWERLDKDSCSGVPYGKMR